MYGGEDSGYDEDEFQASLHTALRTGSKQDIENALTTEGLDLNGYYDGQTALHTAVTSGRSDICDVINLLLDHGADKDAQTIGDSNTPLHLAVLHGSFPRDFDLIVLFLEARVDLSTRNKALRTPYDCAVASGQYELAGCLDGTVTAADAKEFYTKEVAQRYGPYVIEAVLESNEIKLRQYLDIGGSPNVLNKHGCGAIHYAVTHCKLPVYDTLLALLHAKANANIQDEEGDTALNLVIKNKKLHSNGEMVRCVQLLMDSGARANLKDLDDKDACIVAEEKGYDDVLAILKGRHAKKKTPSPPPSPLPPPQPQPSTEPPPEEEQTPREADVNAPNADGLYPIHVATGDNDQTQRHEKISTLLDKGALVDAQIVPTGDTSLHICAEKDYGETAGLLLEHHIDYTIQNNEGKTAYELAQEKGHTSVAEAIEEKQRQVRAQWQKAGKKAKFCSIL